MHRDGDAGDIAVALGNIPRLSARELQRRIADDWRVTSYSGLQSCGRGITAR
jgi:hypothetical protein